MSKFKIIIISLLVILSSNFVYSADLFNNSKSSIIQKNSLIDFNQNKNNGPLEVNEAFQPDFILGNESFEVTFNIQSKYYIYKEKISLNINGKTYPLSMPKSEKKNDPIFGNVDVFENYTTFKTIINSKEDKLDIVLKYQGCSEEFKICYPMETKNIIFPNIYKDNYSDLNQVTQPTINEEQNNITENTNIFNNSSDANFISDFIAKENYPFTLLVFLFLGILMAFTPCIFPMVPIISGLIVKHDKQNPLKVSILYVLGIALCYSIIGLVLKLLNFNIQIALQNIYLLIITSIFMFILAANMFGWINLTMPTFLQSKIHDKTVRLDKSNNPLSLIAIGFLSALILSPCAVAPLAGTLLFASQYDNIIYSSTLLFILGIGSGIPLIIWATSIRKFLPKAGKWMYEVKNVLGLLLVFVGLYLLSKIIPLNDGSFISILFKTSIFGVFVAYIIRFLETSKKNKIILFLIFFLLSLNINMNKNVNNIDNAKNYFINISKLEDIVINKKTLLYVGADWCVSCKEMEYTTFSDPNVITELKNFNVYFLDITNIDEEKKKILQKFNLQIAPFYVLYDKEGTQKKEIYIGYIDKNKFLEILKK